MIFTEYWQIVATRDYSDVHNPWIWRVQHDERQQIRDYAAMSLIWMMHRKVGAAKFELIVKLNSTPPTFPIANQIPTRSFRAMLRNA